MFSLVELWSTERNLENTLDRGVVEVAHGRELAVVRDIDLALLRDNVVTDMRAEHLTDNQIDDVVERIGGKVSEA